MQLMYLDNMEQTYKMIKKLTGCLKNYLNYYYLKVVSHKNLRKVVLKTQYHDNVKLKY